MESTRMAFGRRGEDRAAEYIENLGWQVLARNWRCREGEADIVAYDPSADALVVVEVKSRSSTEFGSPLEAITYAKVRTLRHLAAIFARRANVADRGTAGCLPAPALDKKRCPVPAT